MLALLAQLLGIIPGLTGLASTIATAAFDAKVKMLQARTGADQAVATEIVRKAEIDSHESIERLRVVAGSRGLLVLTFMFATPFALYIWKVVIWDIVVGSIFANGVSCHEAPMFCTDPIKGDVAAWGATIIASLFGSASAVTLGSMWFNRKGQ